MPRYVALLRSINVGGHSVKMDRLRSLFLELKLDHVETFIASGNVLFDARSRSIPILERRIEDHLDAALGYEVATFLRPLGDLAAVTARHPFDALEQRGKGLYVGFLKSTPSAEQRDTILSYATPLDEFHIHATELYWLCHTRFSDSTVNAKAMEKSVGMPFTFRNMNTVRSLAAKQTPRS